MGALFIKLICWGGGGGCGGLNLNLLCHISALDSCGLTCQRVCTHKIELIDFDQEGDSDVVRGKSF